MVKVNINRDTIDYIIFVIGVLSIIVNSIIAFAAIYPLLKKWRLNRKKRSKVLNYIYNALLEVSKNKDDKVKDIQYLEATEVFKSNEGFLLCNMDDKTFKYLKGICIYFYLNGKRISMSTILKEKEKCKDYKDIYLRLEHLLKLLEDKHKCEQINFNEAKR